MFVGIADTNALVCRQWMGELFYESMRITQILQFTVLTDVDVNGSQNSESLLLLDNEMLNCIFIVIILSCQRIL